MVPVKCAWKAGHMTGPYDFSSRMDDGKGARPEELLGATTPDVFR